MQLGYVGQHGTDLLNFEDLSQRIGLNAAGQIAKPGQLIVNQMAGPYLGGGYTPCDMANLSQCGATGSLYQADQNGALAGANMSNSNQSYNSLQAVLEKRMGDGLQGQVAYTYSKCLSNSPGYFGTGWGSTDALAPVASRGRRTSTTRVPIGVRASSTRPTFLPAMSLTSCRLARASSLVMT